MPNSAGPGHIVVDGSNIATEGRSMPSLQQLNEAVTSFMADHPDVPVTVVVDATFGHRIDKSERAEFDEAVANNELVAPPAGAVGRGDAFVLNIAQKSGATVLSNDSFQEFHGTHEWLFEEGRLIGGKPVPHVGWVFVARNPVRGTVSRQATRASRKSESKPAKAEAPASASTSKSARKGKSSPLANEPMPTPKTPPPGAASVNELVPFLDFVERHPVGTSCSGVVEAYSSHGAYLRVGEVRVYVPLRLMSDPPPQSARKMLKMGESVTVVIAGFVPARRSIDAGLPGMVDATAAPSEQEPPARPTAKKAAVKRAAATKTAPKKAAPKKAVAKKTA
ncbi:MAG: S1 RNA-binding domain-containing protein, partial [Ilumatobacter sp.]